MSLGDGEYVELEFEPGIAEPSTGLQRLCWILVWKGREEFFYHGSYVFLFRGLILRALRAAAAQRFSGPPLNWSAGIRELILRARALKPKG